MRTRLDVRKIIGQLVLSNRLAAVDRQLSSHSIRDERSLVFLATFMHHCAGSTDQATQSAKMLKKLAGTDKLMRAYAEYILTGELPGKLPASAPAKGGR